MNWAADIFLIPTFYSIRWIYFDVSESSWDNRTGWLGVKHQWLTNSLSLTKNTGADSREIILTVIMFPKIGSVEVCSSSSARSRCVLKWKPRSPPVQVWSLMWLSSVAKVTRLSRCCLSTYASTKNNHLLSNWYTDGILSSCMIYRLSLYSVHTTQVMYFSSCMLAKSTWVVLYKII